MIKEQLTSYELAFRRIFSVGLAIECLRMLASSSSAHPLEMLGIGVALGIWLHDENKHKWLENDIHNFFDKVLPK